MAKRNNLNFIAIDLGELPITHCNFLKLKKLQMKRDVNKCTLHNAMVTTEIYCNCFNSCCTSLLSHNIAVFSLSDIRRRLL